MRLLIAMMKTDPSISFSDAPNEEAAVLSMPDPITPPPVPDNPVMTTN